MAKETVNINYNDIEFEVVGWYQPEEDMVMYYPDGSGHPGAAAEFEIEELLYEGADFAGMMSEGTEEKIIELVMDKLS